MVAPFLVLPSLMIVMFTNALVIVMFTTALGLHMY